MRRILPYFNRVLILLSVITLSVFPLACAAPSLTPASPLPATKPVVPPPAATATAAPPVATSPASPVATPGASLPTIHIETPLPFTLTRTGDITMTVKVTNFKLVDKIDQPNAPGEGHIDWYMDVDVPIAQGVPAIPEFGAHFASASTTFTWTNVPVGTRQFAVQLVENDHTPLRSPVVDSILLNVVPPPTGPAIYGAISVGQSDEQEPDAFYYDPIKKEALVAVSTRDFTVVDVSNQTSPQNVAGEGHFIYYMDIDAAVVGKINLTPGSAAVAYKTSYLWKNVQPGYHTFSVQAVNNDNLPLNPPLVYKIAINLVDITGGTTSPAATRTPASTATPGTASPAPSATATMSPSPTP